MSCRNNNSDIQFNPNIYRLNSQDLRQLKYSDADLLAHFNSIGFTEPRRYSHTATKSDFISNCYFRGHGIEIGAGANPITMMGNATCDYGDIAEDALFDTDDFKLKKIIINLNKTIDAESPYRQKYDFVVAQHVLEHCDSLIRGLVALKQLCKNNGIVYFSLPIINFDVDILWMDKYSFVHHCIEYLIPSFFKIKHKKKYLRSLHYIFNADGKPQFQGSSVTSESLYHEMINGNLPKELEYIFHRHSYSFQDWTRLILKINNVFKLNMELIDCGFGHDRNDIHFVFKVNQYQPIL